MNGTCLRLFVAIALPPERRKALLPSLQAVQAVAPQARPIAAQNLHLTLRFLGPVAADDASKIAATLSSIASRHAPLDLALRGSGTFGPPRRPHLLYAAIAEPGGRGETGAQLEGLASLAADLRRSLGPAEPETGAEPPFTPHVSLARARGRGGDPGLAEAAAALAGLDAGPFSAAGLTLYESHLSPGGARYQPRAYFALRGDRPLRGDRLPA